MQLRAFTHDDIDLLVALDSDPEVKRFIDGGLDVDRGEVIEMLEQIAGPDRVPGYGFWAATDPVTGAFIGWFHLRPQLGDDPSQPELGYRLHRAVWGRGLASEGASELVRYAFEERAASVVYAETMAVNLASRRVMENAGLRYVRTFVADWPVPIDGDEHGDVRYEITRAEWEANRRPR